MSSVVSSEQDVFALPDAELVFGLGGGRERRHAVTRDMAVQCIGDGDAVAGAVCGQLVEVLPKWGAYQRDSRYLRGCMCVPCAWIVAAARHELPAQIAATHPKDKHRGILAAAIGDALLGVRLLETIAAGVIDDSLVGRFERSQQADLLAQAAQHLPVVVVCEECLDTGEDGSHDDGPCEQVVCPTCTLTAGPWAGEYEGYTLPECIVDAPCSVLRTLCSHYEINLPEIRIVH